jgi:hypothetical protein
MKKDVSEAHRTFGETFATRISKFLPCERSTIIGRLEGFIDKCGKPKGRTELLTRLNEWEAEFEYKREIKQQKKASFKQVVASWMWYYLTDNTLIESPRRRVVSFSNTVVSFN